MVKVGRVRVLLTLPLASVSVSVQEKVPALVVGVTGSVEVPAGVVVAAVLQPAAKRGVPASSEK
jgi:hypothetical protein